MSLPRLAQLCAYCDRRPPSTQHSFRVPWVEHRTAWISPTSPVDLPSVMVLEIPLCPQCRSRYDLSETLGYALPKHAAAAKNVAMAWHDFFIAGCRFTLAMRKVHWPHGDGPWRLHWEPPARLKVST